MTPAVDISRLPLTPYTVWPEKVGPAGTIWNANNEFVAEIKAETREILLELARLIEDATRR